MITRNPLLLHLDFADKDIHSDGEIRAAAGEGDAGATVIRASALGAVPSPTGSPEDWGAAADVVLRMARRVDVAGRAQQRTPRTIVTGRAGLPLFALLGAALSARHPDVLLLNRRKDNPRWDRIDLGRPPVAREDAGAPFFSVRSGFRASDQPGRVSVTVSTNTPRGLDAARAYLSERGEAVAGEVEIRTHAEPDPDAVRWLTGDNGHQAAAELVELFGQLPTLFPRATGLALFIDGPATLAYLVGRALVQRLPLHRDVWIPNFQVGAYRDAIRLPHRPRLEILIVHHGVDQAFADELEKRLRAERPRFFHRGHLLPGDDVAAVLQRRVDAANVVAVLLSPDLVADDALCGLVDRALARLADARTRVAPVQARKCQWEGALPGLGGRRATPAGEWLRTANNDDLWNEVDRDLHRLVREVRAELFGDDQRA